MAERLKMLPVDQYIGVDNREDPVRFYKYPIIGSIYRRRVELCLSELRGGRRILEVGFGSGVTFLNLREKYDEIYGLDLTADVGRISEMFARLGMKTTLKNGSVLEIPFPDGHFDAVLLISILEHLRPEEHHRTFSEIARVLSPGGQVVYGVPVQRPLMDLLFRLTGYNIKDYHFSSEKDVLRSAETVLKINRVININAGPFGSIYEVGHFIKV